MEYFAKTIPIQIRWDNIQYTVEEKPGCCGKKEKTKKTHILNNLSGVVEPGQMLAVMGPSGSGKTSLLNVLSGKLFGRYEGEVSINGQIADKRLIKRIAGFVPQEDILFGSQTVREALQFYADLKLPTTLSSREKSEMIDYILEELGLKKVEHSLIGYVGADAATSGLARGLSGGERKRLSIGCQLISNPSLIFLDEPTTGLDSYASESVINTLSKLSLQGRTIIFTIHQPSVEVLSLFDRILLLGRGNTVYNGTNAEMLDYFKGIGYTCPVWENPANFLMDTIHGDSSTYEEKLNSDEGGPALDTKYDKAREQALKLAKLFEESELAQFKVKKAPLPVPTKQGENTPGFFTGLRCVVGRQFKHILREPAALRAGLGQVIIIAVVMGLIYLRLGYTNTDLQNRTGALFFGVVFISFGGILGPFFHFGTERKIFLFQHQDGLYSTAVFYSGKVLAEAPTFVLTTIIWSSIFYWMIGFRGGADHFFIYYAMTLLIINVAFAYGMMIVNLIPDPQVALNIFPLLFMPLMIFSGFYLNKDNTPPYFIWVQYISFIKYSFQVIMNNEFTDVAFRCTSSELQTVANVTFCPFTNGNSWLKFYHTNDFPIYGGFLIMIEFLILFHLIAFITLRRAAKSESG